MTGVNIKSRLGKSKGKRIRNNGMNRRFPKSPAKVGTGNIKSRLGINVQKSVFETDIRSKIIAKKRQNITDARDRLAEIAKQGDARLKLNKLKTNAPQTVQNQNGHLQVLAKGNIKKTVKNTVKRLPNSSATARSNHNGNSEAVRSRPNYDGPFSNVPKSGHNVTAMKGGALTRTVSGASRQFPVPNVQYSSSIRPQMNKKPPPRSAQSTVKNTERYHPLRNNLNVVTIKNENAINPRKQENNRSSNNQFRVQQTIPDYGQENYQFQTAPIYNNFGGPSWAPQQNMHMQVQEEVRPTQLRITTPNNYMDFYAPPPVQPQRYEETFAPPSYRPSVPARPQAPKRSSYDMYEGYTAPSKKQELSSEIISRLDRPQRSNDIGFKIWVTNLHTVVTLEDVQELFGNIGPIKSARIVRSGVAEIVFTHEKDALRSVEVYHNRQLDGLPMSVSIIPRRNEMPPARQLPRRDPSPVHFLSDSPLRRPSALFHPSMGNRDTTKSVLRAAGGGSSHVQDSSQLYNKRIQRLDVSPDISTIHQALFSGKGNAPLANQQFYVKLPKPALRGMK